MDNYNVTTIAKYFLKRDETGGKRCGLFDRNAFGEITRHIDVIAQSDGDFHREEL